MQIHFAGLGFLLIGILILLWYLARESFSWFALGLVIIGFILAALSVLIA
jgi:hypothetical protein